MPSLNEMSSFSRPDFSQLLSQVINSQQQELEVLKRQNLIPIHQQYSHSTYSDAFSL